MWSVSFATASQRHCRFAEVLFFHREPVTQETQAICFLIAAVLG